MIRWVFLDVGNVLFNDEPQTCHILRRYHEALAQDQPELSFDQFLRAREGQVRQGNRWPTQSVMLQFLSARRMDQLYEQTVHEVRGIYDAVNLPMPQMALLLEKLCRSYRLGIIANQVIECRASLERRGVSRHFDVLAISEELSLHKPDRALFEWALDQAGVSPDEAVMVGDRHDNDVVPAAELGMQTIWVRWSSHRDKGWHPDDPLARQFLESQDRAPFYAQVTRPDVAATAVVPDIASVAAAVDRLAAP
jgi:HAD superfamily hydrolase (TIGR01549 family)